MENKTSFIALSTKVEATTTVCLLFVNTMKPPNVCYHLNVIAYRKIQKQPCNSIKALTLDVREKETGGVQFHLHSSTGKGVRASQNCLTKSCFQRL